MIGIRIRIIELRGIQASGKTTTARAWLENFPDMCRVNRDDLRAMLRGKGYSLYKDERLVKACEAACVTTILKDGRTAIVDDTNLSGSMDWSDVAEAEGALHVVKDFKVSLKEAIRRDSLRENPVGEKVIRFYAGKYPDWVEHDPN